MDEITTRRYHDLNGLSIRTPRLELRDTDERWLLRLAGLAEDGIHDPAVQPFTNAWTDVGPAQRGEAVMDWWWEKRDAWSEQDWDCEFTVLRRGTWGDVIGVQSLAARDFAQQRTVRTGSWLGLPYQRQGYGTEMRAAVLHLAFIALGAYAARTVALRDNMASRRINARFGYELTGIHACQVRDRPTFELHYTLTRDTYVALPPRTRLRDQIEVRGLPGCRRHFGAAGTSELKELC